MVWSHIGLIVAGSIWALSTMTAIAQETPRTVQNVPGLQRRGEEAPLLKMDARLVVLDVVVTDRNGHAVPGLKASDFTLTESGLPQKLTSVVEHSRIASKSLAGTLAGAKLPPNTFSDHSPVIDESSAIVLVLDALSSSVENQMRVLHDMLVYMKGVSPGTRIAIMQLGDTGLHMIQGFSSDPAELSNALKGKRVMPALASPLLELGLEDPAEMAAVAVPVLTQYLSGYPGRKSVIWFYQGDEVNATSGLNLRALFHDRSSFIEKLGKSSQVLTLNQIALYPVDTSAIHLSWEGVDADAIAARTGGKAFYNTNGLKEAVQEVAEGAWNYYTVSYSPRNRVFSGEFRRLEIQVGSPDLHCQYRAGYFAKNDAANRMIQIQEAASGVTPPVGNGSTEVTSIDAAMLMGAPAPRDVLFLAHIDPSAAVSKGTAKAPLAMNNFLEGRYRKEKFREYGIHYNVQADSLRLAQSSDDVYRGRIDFVAMVYDDMGNEVNSIVSRASIHADQQMYRQIMDMGVEVTQSIAVPVKGKFFLRVGVHDVVADKAGALEVPVGELQLGLQSRVASPTRP